jgi:hypothetical protein
MIRVQRAQEYVGVGQDQHLEAAFTVDEIAAHGLVRQQGEVVTGVASRPGFELADPFFRGEFRGRGRRLPGQQNVADQLVKRQSSRPSFGKKGLLDVGREIQRDGHDISSFSGYSRTRRAPSLDGKTAGAIVFNRFDANFNLLVGKLMELDSRMSKVESKLGIG